MTKTTCPNHLCNEPTPADFPTCVHCGGRLLMTATVAVRAGTPPISFTGAKGYAVAVPPGAAFVPSDDLSQELLTPAERATQDEAGDRMGVASRPDRFETT